MNSLKGGKGCVSQPDNYFLINDNFVEEKVEETGDNSPNNEDAFTIVGQTK